MTEVGRGALRAFARARLNVPRALAFFRSYDFAAAAPVIVYSPVQLYSNPPSAVPVELRSIQFPHRTRIKYSSVPRDFAYPILRMALLPAGLFPWAVLFLTFALYTCIGRANLNSVYVAEELGISPPHVRTILHRLGKTWEKMNDPTLALANRKISMGNCSLAYDDARLNCQGDPYGA